METFSRLTAIEGLCTKQFRKVAGSLVQLDQTMPFFFDHASIEVDSLEALAAQLQTLESLPSCQIIRGRLIAGRAAESIRRTFREPRKLQWLLVATGSCAT